MQRYTSFYTFLLIIVLLAMATGCNNQKSADNLDDSSSSLPASTVASPGAISNEPNTEKPSADLVAANTDVTGSAVRATSLPNKGNSKQTNTPVPKKRKSEKKPSKNSKNNSKKSSKKSGKDSSTNNGKKKSKDNNKELPLPKQPQQKQPQTPGTSTPSDNFKGTKITLGSNIKIEGSGASANGNVVHITEAGSYRITGTLTNGQIILNRDKADFNIELAGVSIKCSNGPAFLVSDAHLTKITLKSGTTNYIEDGGNVAKNDAALFCDDDLTIDGQGTLIVKGNNSEGIETNETLTINGGTIKITTKDDGINAKNQIIQNAGYVYTESSGNGLDSDGSININSGTVIVYAGSDKSPITPGDTMKIKINGGTVFAVGGKLSDVDANSAQYSIKIKSNITADKSFYVSAGNSEIFTTKTKRSGTRVWFSSPSLKGNTIYGISLGNTTIGTIKTTQKCVSFG